MYRAVNTGQPFVNKCFSFDIHLNAGKHVPESDHIHRKILKGRNMTTSSLNLHSHATLDCGSIAKIKVERVFS